MSVLINGISIPSTDEPHVIVLYPNGEVGDYYDIKGAPIGKAVEIPPHGDLIDREDLTKRLGITDMDCYKCAWGNNGYCKNGGEFAVACEAVEEMPVVIPAESAELNARITRLYVGRGVDE